MTIVARLPIEMQPNKANVRYLQTKKEKMGHLLKI
jgi:GTP cyclohydrolase II